MLFPSGSLPSGPAIEPRKALLLIDFQDDFVNQENGKLPIPNVGTFINRLPGLIAKFRSKGTVVFIRTEFQGPRSALYPELSCHNILLHDSLARTLTLPDGQVRRHRRGRSSLASKSIDPEAFLQAGPDDQRVCVADSLGSQLCKVLAPTLDPERDLSIVKSHYSAFTDTSLLLQLRTHMIQQVYIAGTLSNISVYATVLDAVRHGIEVTLIEDCLGYRDVSCHEAAMRQMADIMGALGTDHQELMDELAGLLGDVIREEDFGTRFQVSVGPPTSRQNSKAPIRQPVSPEQTKQRVQDWIIDNDKSPEAEQPLEVDGDHSKLEVDPLVENESRSHPQSPIIRAKPATPEVSPPRKRSTEEFEDDDQQSTSRSPHKASIRRTSSDAQPENNRHKVNRIRMRASRPSRESSSRTNAPYLPKTVDAPLVPGKRRESYSLVSDAARGERSVGPASAPNSKEHGGESAIDKKTQCRGKYFAVEGIEEPLPRKKRIKNSMTLVGPAEIIGEGDCIVTAPILSPSEADIAFYDLKRTVQWQKMFHRTGEVPRLVAVQGQIQEDCGSHPIYRHPADESPEILPFDETVNMIRLVCEKTVGHELNHALIQYYRSGEDNISEHSDKTLDIVRGSSIVNFSLGAQRIMTIRTKKETPSPTNEEQQRTAQRIPLMHNSIFVLGETTNRFWLHSVRPDKRPNAIKGVEELAYGGERISLTFRQIGTFVDKKANIIWGQGATSKSRESARTLLDGEAAEREGEKMIRAFGQENHQSASWEWDEWYGRGFDVINFDTKAP